jgi:hypothetical protein
MSDHDAALPEFHLVVRRPGRGPLAPYRLVLVVMFTLATTGRSLWVAGVSGVNVDGALIRTAIAGVLAWIVLGRVNAILKSAAPPPVRTALRSEASEASPA